MESSESEAEMPLPASNVYNDARSINSRCSIDADESNDSRSTSSNLQSSDSGVSTASDFSNYEDWSVKETSSDESKNHRKIPTGFLRNLIPWMEKSTTRVSPIRNNPRLHRGVDKIGGTLALIQHPRPPDLPVKNPAEDRCHRKQYNVILEEARKRETRESCARQRRREEQLKREERLVTDSTIWYKNILPNFESLRDTRKVRELWWCGLPPSIRGKVWKLGIANDLKINSRQYDIYKDRMNRDETLDESVVAIKLDVSRTFSNLGIFQEGGPLFEILQSLLTAYTIYRTDIGYVQGMSFIGAVLTLNMEPNDAFVCFANLLNKPCHRAAFTLNQKQMNVYYKVFSSALAHKIPKIHLHFCATGLSPDFYLLDWLYTIYAKAMPLDVVCRIWDVFVRDGDEFLFRTALGILHMFQDELLRMDFVRCAQFLTKLPENLQASVLFDNIGKMTTSIGVRTFHDMISQLS